MEFVTFSSSFLTLNPVLIFLTVCLAAHLKETFLMHALSLLLFRLFPQFSLLVMASIVLFLRDFTRSVFNCRKSVIAIGVYNNP